MGSNWQTRSEEADETLLILIRQDEAPYTSSKSNGTSERAKQLWMDKVKL